jgi:hypothetical protein
MALTAASGNILWVTCPCIQATPLTYPEHRSASRVMFRVSACPSAQRSAHRCLPKTGPARSGGKASCPAGTGVWVVKTQFSRMESAAAPTASARSPVHRAPASFSSIRPRVMSAACPSFMWNRSMVAWSSALSILTPPMPRTVSWSRRMRLSPP